MKCPICGLINPEAAAKCDCGYQFGGGSAKDQESNRALQLGHQLEAAQRHLRTADKWGGLFVVAGFLALAVGNLVTHASLRSGNLEDALGVLVVAVFHAGLVGGLFYGMRRESRVCGVLLLPFPFLAFLLALIGNINSAPGKFLFNSIGLGYMVAAYPLFRGVRATFTIKKIRRAMNSAVERDSSPARATARVVGLLVFGCWFLGLALFPPVRSSDYIDHGNRKRYSVEWGNFIYDTREGGIAWDYLSAAALVPGAAVVLLLRWKPTGQDGVSK